jgi:hypothetical protein
MATGLEHFKIFSEAIDEAETILKKLGANWSLKGKKGNTHFWVLAY